MGLLSSFLYLAMHNNWLWGITLSVGLYYLYMRKWIAHYDTSIDRTDKKTFIVTGAESGIGKMCVDLLAPRGGRIIMACKDTTLGQASRAQIVERTLNDNIEVRHLDLSCLKSVRKFAQDILSSEDHLDVLVNNPGSSCPADTTTPDGLNSIMQVNHFAPFLLTNLLLDLLKKSAPSRVVFVSSIYHHFHKFSLDNLNCESQPLPKCRVLFNAKLASILTAKYFARMLQGTGVTVNSVHPGIVRSDEGATTCDSMTGMLYNLWLNIFGKTAREGAMTLTYCATENKIKHITGHHFAECKVSHCVAKIANDRILQDKLFEKTSRLVQLMPEETHI